MKRVFVSAAALAALITSAGAQDLYFTDYTSKVINRVSADGVVHLFSNDPQLTAPAAIAFDNGGTMYVTNNGGLYKVQANGAATLFATGLGTGDDIAFDHEGNAWVTSSGLTLTTGNGYVRKVDQSGQVTTVLAQVNYPVGIAIGPDDLPYWTDDPFGHLNRINADGSVTELVNFRNLDSFSASPKGLAFDSSGNIFVADQRNGVHKVTPALIVSTFAHTQNPLRLAYAPNGDLFVADGATPSLPPAISRISSAGVVTPFASGFPSVVDLAVGPVPEPASVCAIVLGLATLARRRRH